MALADLPGVDDRTVERLSAAVAAFRSAAETLDAQLATAHPHRSQKVGGAMLSVERDLLTELVALDVFDQYIFPHQQLQRDATRMHLAAEALKAGDPARANGTYVGRTGLTNAGRRFAYEAYVAELARHEPSADRLQWGAQAHLASYVDLWQEYHSINSKIADGLTDPADYADEIRALRAKLRPVYRELNRRLGRMAKVFDQAARGLRKASHHAGK